MNALVKQFEQAQTPAPTIPHYTIEELGGDQVTVQIHIADQAIQYTADYETDSHEGCTGLSATCTMTTFDQDGLVLTEDVIQTPSWMQYIVPSDVDDYLTRCAEQHHEDMFGCMPY